MKGAFSSNKYDYIIFLTTVQKTRGFSIDVSEALMSFLVWFVDVLELSHARTFIHSSDFQH